MRTFTFTLFFPLLILLSGCLSEPCSCPYGSPENWVILEAEKPDSSYDVFYVYPTLAGKADTPEMEWRGNAGLQKKITGFAWAQTEGIFGKNVRIFAPYVHQLTYDSVLKIMTQSPLNKAEWPKFERGMKETLAAFRHYRRHYGKGRPYILLGHSQGAMDLYYLLEHCPEIKVENGFAAAYLIGLPHIRASQMKKDFGTRIQPARNADDVGTVIVWNTQNASATSGFMAGNGEYCINPLNWRTDAAAAGPELHLGACFYDYRTDSSQRKKHLFGARVDPARGVLIVDLPSNSVWDANAFMGQGIFHMNDVWFFAENLRVNAENRIRRWKEGKFHE